MKPCATLKAEPQGLADFRLANPRERSWQVFRDEHRGAYGELALALENRQRGLCAFCEAPLITNVPTPARQVEHWRPKAHDPTPAADWTFGVDNMHASCLGGTKSHLAPPHGTLGLSSDRNLSCGQKKGDFDPGTIALHQRPYRPTELPLSPPIFAVDLAGGVNPSAEAVEAGLDQTRLQATIDFLGLDCERLRIARASVRTYLNARLAEYEVEASGANSVEITSNALAAMATDFQIAAGAELPPFVSVLRDFLGLGVEGILLPDPNWPFG